MAPCLTITLTNFRCCPWWRVMIRWKFMPQAWKALQPELFKHLFWSFYWIVNIRLYRGTSEKKERQENKHNTSTGGNKGGVHIEIYHFAQPDQWDRLGKLYNWAFLSLYFSFSRFSCPLLCCMDKVEDGLQAFVSDHTLTYRSTSPNTRSMVPRGSG